MQHNWHFLDVSVRDAARDVLNKSLTFEEAAAKYSVAVAYIEAKVTDPDYHPPQLQKKTSTIVDALRHSAPVQPRDVLTAEEKATKAAIIADKKAIEKEKRSPHPFRVQCIKEAARDVTAKRLTPRAAAEKFNLAVEDVIGQVANPLYAEQLKAPLGPNERPKQKIVPSAKWSPSVSLPRRLPGGGNVDEIEIPSYSGRGFGGLKDFPI